MSYTIQGVIAKAGTLPKALPWGLQLVPLQAGLEMIPFTSAIRSAHDLAFCPLTDGDCNELPETLAALCLQLSERCELAYIEAELFGGAGTQAHAFFVHNKAAGTPQIARDAINSALLRLGVRRRPDKDEFDVVGLGQHRNTDSWVQSV